eukprot:8813668-Alexandrium_andersonii.AAC.1
MVIDRLWYPDARQRSSSLQRASVRAAWLRRASLHLAMRPATMPRNRFGLRVSTLEAAGGSLNFAGGHWS